MNRELDSLVFMNTLDYLFEVTDWWILLPAYRQFTLVSGKCLVTNASNLKEIVGHFWNFLAESEVRSTIPLSYLSAQNEVSSFALHKD